MRSVERSMALITRGFLRGIKNHVWSRSAHTAKGIKDGVVLGVYKGKGESEFSLTPEGESRASPEIVASSGPVVKEGTCRILHQNGTLIALVGLGEKKPSEIDEREERNLSKEAIRTAIAAGVRALKSSYASLDNIQVDSCGDPEASAEGAVLSQWKYDELKNKKALSEVRVSCLGGEIEDWKKGVIKAEGQNFARTLMETPANYLTPTLYSEKIISQFSSIGTIDVKVHDQAWAERMNMGSFLSVSAGSAEPPKFLEMTYGANDSPPTILIGKGVTFDSGGISIKPSKNMDAMRADMGGAACVTGALYSVASMNLPLHLKVLIPLCENMPGGRAVKPGDVVKAMNGKTIQVDNTDAEGRLILADALCYADTFNPSLVLDVATLTGAMAVALGGGAAGVYTDSSRLWNEIRNAGSYTGDRVWRMPLWKTYTKQITESALADLNNIGSVPYGGSCTAAAFLKEFTKCSEWIHLDIAGVMDSDAGVSYVSKGMTGRPTRTLVEFLGRS